MQIMILENTYDIFLPPSFYRDFLGPMGHAELLSDATLVDLLYRGNRDTSVAHTLLNKV